MLTSEDTSAASKRSTALPEYPLGDGPSSSDDADTLDELPAKPEAATPETPDSAVQSQKGRKSQGQRIRPWTGFGPTRIKRSATAPAPSTPLNRRSSGSQMDIDQESLAANDEIDLAFYLPAARHYAWVKQVQQSEDWHDHLQLFLDMDLWQSSPAAFLFVAVSTTTILAQVVLMMVETDSFSISEVAPLDRCAIWIISWVITSVFTLELVLRTVSMRSVSELCSSAAWWVDFVSVAPDYLVLIISVAVRGSKMNPCVDAQMQTPEAIEIMSELLRAFRVVRILKILRLNPDTLVLFRAISLSMRALAVPLAFLFIGAFFYGALIFYFEHMELVLIRGLPDAVKFNDLGEAIWCMIVTFTTVGYGDVSPVSHMGKAICAVAILNGVILLAMPLNIVGANFAVAWEERSKLMFVRQVQKKCIDQRMSLAGIRRLFQEADTHNSGQLDYLEFRALCRELGLYFSSSEARRLFKLFDEDQTGEISFFEYCHLIFPNLDVEMLYEKGAFTLSGTIAEEEPRTGAGAVPLPEGGAAATDQPASFIPSSYSSRQLTLLKQAFRAEELESRAANLVYQPPPSSAGALVGGGANGPYRGIKSRTMPQLPQLPLPTQQAPSPARSFKRASSFRLGDGSGGARKSSGEARAALHQLPLAARVTARLDAQDARLEELRAMLERLVEARLPQEEGGGGGGGGGGMDSDGHHDAALST